MKISSLYNINVINASLPWYYLKYTKSFMSLSSLPWYSPPPKITSKHPELLWEQINENWEFETDPKNEETDPKKEETDQQAENLQRFWKSETDPKKRGNGPKKKRKPITKLRIYNFFWKSEMDPKKGKGLKIRGNRSTNREFTTFSDNGKWTQKKGKPINKLRIYYFFWKPETDPQNEETDRKYWEIPQKYKTRINWNPT